MTFEDLAALSPFPIVHLGTSPIPKDGFLAPLTSTCLHHLRNGSACKKYYQGLVNTAEDTFMQCPYGFTSMVGRAGMLRIALTGVVGHPRFHASPESHLAKKHPHHRFDRDTLRKSGDSLRSVAIRMQKLESETVEQYSMALHEIRKLNRQVKQSAERLCQSESPGDVDAASPELVKILKTSELMTRQFDVIEILANEELAKLPLNGISELYKIFDKCARIYRTGTRKITLDALHRPRDRQTQQKRQ